MIHNSDKNNSCSINKEKKINKDNFNDKEDRDKIMEEEIKDKENHSSKKELSQQEEIYKKWKDTGLLDGLRGNLKESISKMYECCTSNLLTGDTKNK